MSMCSSDFPGNIDASTVPHPPIAQDAWRAQQDARDWSSPVNS